VVSQYRETTSITAIAAWEQELKSGKFWIQVEFGLHATQSGQSARLPVPAAGSGQDQVFLA